ncbi:MAG: DMT family transporter [Thalassotalea sp.]
MSLVIAYLAVILIWSTTPLGIVWSSTSVSPSLALLLRMMIALMLGLVWLKLTNVRFPWHKQAIKFYSFSALGIAGGMYFTYLSARSIPSGLISLIFGISPILSGVFAQKILKEQPFTVFRKLALILSFSGLLIVCFDKISLANNNAIGIFYVLIAVTLFSISGVLVKSVKINIHPLASTVGTLTIAMPFFIISWFIFDGQFVIPAFEKKAFWSIIYLGVFGSLIGFMAYFYVLKRMSASTVSLVTLMTPIIAITLGNQLNNESISPSLILGSAFVMFGLFLYFFGHRAVFNYPVNTLK